MQIVFKGQQNSVIVVKAKLPQNWACVVKRLAKHKDGLSLLSLVVYRVPQEQ